MGRLSSVAASSLAASSLAASSLAAMMFLTGCNDAANKPAEQRTNQVTASAIPGAASQVPATSTTKPKPKRTICTSLPGKGASDLPEQIVAWRSVEGTAEQKPLTLGKRWLWLNFWAAWCEPCKKEMPMLQQWQRRLKGMGIEVELAFISIDDDDRELTRFLSKQPQRGVRASYWIGDEKTRKAWFDGLGYKKPPALPVHAFINPKGDLACVVDGVLEESDFASLKKLIER